MSRQPKKSSRHRQLTGAEFTARYRAEKILQQQRYCDAFEQWRRCANRRCRRQRACTGDRTACLKRVLTTVPHAAQWRAREDILAATPHNIGAPERAARQCMPIDCYAATAAQAVADYLARFGPNSARRRGEGSK